MFQTPISHKFFSLTLGSDVQGVGKVDGDEGFGHVLLHDAVDGPLEAVLERVGERLFAVVAVRRLNLP